MSADCVSEASRIAALKATKSSHDRVQRRLWKSSRLTALFNAEKPVLSPWASGAASETIDLGAGHLDRIESRREIPPEADRKATLERQISSSCFVWKNSDLLFPLHTKKRMGMNPFIRRLQVANLQTCNITEWN